MRRAGEFVLGGVLVYVITAALSASGCRDDRFDPADGAGGQGGVASATGGEGGGAARAGRGGASGGAGRAGSGGILDPVPDADAATPGSRLKPKVLEGADGSRQPTTLWHDAERNEECAFQKTADGQMRCVPTDARVATGFYSDANCTVPYLAVPNSVPYCPAPALPKYVLDPGLCGAGARVYKLGELLAGTPNVGTPGACSITLPGQYALQFYFLGEEVPLTSFVSAEVKQAP